MQLNRSFLRVLLCICAVATAVVITSGSNVHAQKSASTEKAAPDAKPPIAADAKVIAKHSPPLNYFKSLIDGFDKEVNEPFTPDARLKALPLLIEKERLKVSDVVKALKPLLKESRERLAKVTAPPNTEGVAEAQALIAERQRIASEAAAFDSLIKNAELLVVRAIQITDRANDKRRERFSTRILSPVDNFYSFSFWQEAALGIGIRASAASRTFADTISGVATNNTWKGLLTLVLPILFGVAIWRVLPGTTRWAWLHGHVDGYDPRRAELGFRAMLKIMRQSAPIVLAFALLYLLTLRFDLLRPAGDELLFNSVSAICFAWVLLAAIRVVFSPRNDADRFLRIDKGAATQVGTLLSVMVVVWLMDSLLGGLDDYFIAPFDLIVLRGVAAALTFAGLLCLILRIPLQAEPAGWRARYDGWPTSLFLVLAAWAAVIAAACMLGYVSLGRFLGAQVVATGGIGLMMYLLHLSSEHLSTVSWPNTGESAAVAATSETGVASSVSTLRLMGTLAFDILILIVGIPAILLQWGYDWSEVRIWLSSAFFGFQIGDFTISIQNLLTALAILAGGVFLTRAIQRWFMKRSEFARRSDTGVRDSVAAGLGYVGFILAAFAATSYLGINFSNLAIIAGALSVGIGFGLQSIVNNFVSGLILLVERPVKVGDWISVGDADGLVRKISVRATELETLDKQSILVPNSEFIGKPVTNWMYKERLGRINVSVGVSYSADVDEVERVLIEAAKSNKYVISRPAPTVVFDDFGSSSLDFLVRVFIADMEHRVPAASSIRFSIWRALKAAGIEIPFPQRDIHIKEIQEVIRGGEHPRLETVS